MGAKKNKKGPYPGAKGKTLQSDASKCKNSELTPKIKKENTVKDDVKSPAEQETPQRLPEKKNRKSTNDASASTPVATPFSPVRRSSRAPVPSSRFKDMEMSLSSRKRSQASSQSEESDGDAEPVAKRKRKISERAEKNTSKQDTSKSAAEESKEKGEPIYISSTKSKVEEEGKKQEFKKPDIEASKQEAAEKPEEVKQHVEEVGKEDEGEKKFEETETTSIKATVELREEEREIKTEPVAGEKIEASANVNTTASGDSVVSNEANARGDKEQSNVEENELFESSSCVPAGMAVEEMVHTFMEEKDVIVVKKSEGDIQDSPACVSSLLISSEEAKKAAASSDIVIKSQEVTLQEKDGQAVAIIKVPTNFGNNQNIASVPDKMPNVDAGKEKIPTVATKTSPVSKNRHGYILNKSLDEQSVVALVGRGGNPVMNISLNHNTLNSVLKPKADVSPSKPPVKTYGRVIKQESSMSAMVIKSPRHSSLSEANGSGPGIVIQNVSSDQPSSLLPQTIKAVSQSEGKTYSLLAPPSELKQMLKGVNEKKSVQGNSSTDSFHISDQSSPPPKVIIIAHPPASEHVTETSTSETVSSMAIDSVTVAASSGTEQVQAEDVIQLPENTSTFVESTIVTSKDTATIAGEAPEEHEKLTDIGPTSALTDTNQIVNTTAKEDTAAEFVIEEAHSTDIPKIGVETSTQNENNKSELLKDENPEDKVQDMESVDGGKNEETSVQNQQPRAISTSGDESKSEIIASPSDRGPVEEVIVTSSDPSSVVKVESQEEGIASPSVNVLSTALAEAEKSQGSGSLKPQKIKLIENGIVYELQIFPEGESKASQDVKTDDESITIKQETPEEEDVSIPDQDVRKLSSGTQTFYSSKKGRPKTSDDGDETDPTVHKLTTIVQEGDQKKHYYYVSVVPGKTLVGKYRHSVDPSLPGCMVNKLGEYCCKECDYKTDKKANFYKHRRLHTGAKPHLCPICKYQARTSSNLKRHMGIHDDIREFKCTQCSMSFRQKIHLERHVRYRHEEKRVKCPMCDYVCANEQPDLKMHIKRKHTQDSGKTFSCPECKLVVGTRRDLKQHLKFHKDGPELKLFCKECSFVTDCKSRLQRHLVVHSNVKPFRCGVCDYKATQKEHVLRHLRSQHKIEVNKPKRPWKKQVKSETPETAQGNTRGDFTCGDKIFACNHCIMRFAKLINLYKHLHTQHSDIMPVETEGNFYCVVCEFSTSSKKNLLVHMRRHNMTDQTPPTHVYSCVLCRYVNPRRRNLFQHMRKKHNIDISSQVDIAGMKEEEVNATQEGVKVTEFIQTEEGVYNQAPAGDISTTTVENTDGNVRVVGGDLAAVANMIKIEDLTRTGVNENDALEDQTLVIDSTATGEGMIHASSLMQHKAADAIEGLQALAGQAGFIIEEEVQGSDKQQTIVIEQGGEVISNSGTTLPDGNITVITADQGIVEEQIAIDGTGSEQIAQIVESEEAMDVSSGMTSLELTEEQLSSFQHGDMIQIEGQVFMVELSQDPDSPDKQLLSFLPVNQA